MKMNAKESEPLRSKSLTVALWLLGLGGLIAAIEVVVGDSTGLRAWLLPLAPWSLGLFLYAEAVHMGAHKHPIARDQVDWKDKRTHRHPNLTQ